jgi:AcrR family transcriptional regulator
MTTATPAAAVRSRDATATRQLLLAAARRHFARTGYSETTVRDIAAEAGVNVALINRYYESKEGLFEACLADAAEGFKRPEASTLDRILVTIIREIAASPNGDTSLKLMLLLRTSGDERADLVRRTTLETFSKRIAIASGVDEDASNFSDVVLRAQMALAATVGIVALRSSTGLEPLSSASEADLEGPMAQLMAALLPS